MSMIKPAIEISNHVGFEVVVHSWLKDEWYLRNPKMINPLISNPNFTNKEENKKRLIQLREFRRPMIDTLPADTIWYKVKIYKKDIERIFHCASKDWGAISNNAFNVQSTISNIFPESMIDFQRSHKIKEIYETLIESPKMDGLILIGISIKSALTIIEGNHRFTAIYYKLKDKEPNQIISENAYLGISALMDNYDLHIGKYFPQL